MAPSRRVRGKMPRRAVITTARTRIWNASEAAYSITIYSTRCDEISRDYLRFEAQTRAPGAHPVPFTFPERSAGFCRAFRILTCPRPFIFAPTPASVRPAGVPCSQTTQTRSSIVYNPKIAVGRESISHDVETNGDHGTPTRTRRVNGASDLIGRRPTGARDFPSHCDF